MGLQDALKKMKLLEDDAPPLESEEAAPQATAPPPPRVTSRSPTAAVVTSMASLGGIAQADPELKAKLEAVAAACNQASYTEFTGYLEALADTLPDELQRYRAAMKTAAKKTHTKAKVLEGLNMIIQALDREAQKFKSAIPQQLENTVGARQRAAATLGEQIKVKQQQRAQLEAEEAQLNTQMQAELAAVNTEENKVRAAEARFNATFAVVRQSYVSESEKITRYGEGVN